MPDVLMPRLSDSMEEGTVLRWLVADGERVESGQELVEIETDKATMVYEAEAAGVLHVLAAEGETLALGRPIATIGDSEVRAHARVRASPVARRIAEELGIDLAALVGSGPQGRVVKADVERAAAPAPEPAPTPAPAPAPPPSDRATSRVPLTRVQRTIARRMVQAKSTMPEFTLQATVDMDAAVALRGELRAAAGDAPAPSYNDLVVKAVALALREHPRANASFHEDGFELHERVDVGVAVAAGDALLVPVVRDADLRGLGAIARETRRLATAAREGTLTARDLDGGTCTVSNLGMFGIEAFTAVLNPPQAAIFAVGALEQRPVARDGALAIGWRMTVTLTCDHRVLYGADGARLLADVRAHLEQPLRLAL